MRRKKSERDEKTFFQQIFKFMSNHAAAVQNLVAFSGIFALCWQEWKKGFSAQVQDTVSINNHTEQDPLSKGLQKNIKSHPSTCKFGCCLPPCITRIIHSPLHAILVFSFSSWLNKSWGYVILANGWNLCTKSCNEGFHPRSTSAGFLGERPNPSQPIVGFQS